MNNSMISTTSIKSSSFLETLKNAVSIQGNVSDRKIHSNLDTLNNRISQFMNQAEKLENSLKKSSEELNNGKSDR